METPEKRGTPAQGNKQMIVKFWDGTEKKVSNRDEAVNKIKVGLREWMQKGDFIIWFQLPTDEKLPSFATIVNDVGEQLDTWAKIMEVNK